MQFAVTRLTSPVAYLPRHGGRTALGYEASTIARCSGCDAGSMTNQRADASVSCWLKVQQGLTLQMANNGRMINYLSEHMETTVGLERFLPRLRLAWARAAAMCWAATVKQEDAMTRLRVAAFSVSLDGFGAGPNQSADNPLGVGGEGLHEWILPTRTFKAMTGKGGGEEGTNDEFVAQGMSNIGAWILGRNMFGPVRGPWPDDSWKGWWGDEPPYHCPVFVLTHHARHSVTMQGGTTFHFVTDGIHAALGRAREAAAGRDVRLGGGASVIQQYLNAKLVDQMHLGIAPVLLGSGERLLAGIDLVKLGYRLAKHVPSSNVTHVVIEKA
jgi:dihydrofolate reductase